MSHPSHPRLRRRLELAIGAIAPVLDLTLAAGTLISRLITRESPDLLVPSAAARAGRPAPRALSPRGRA